VATVSYNENTVASSEQYSSLLAFLITYSLFGIFRCDFFHFNVLQQSYSEIRLLVSTCASLYCSHAKQIRDFNKHKEQAKVTLLTGNHRTLPTKDKQKGDSKKMTKACLALML